MAKWGFETRFGFIRFFQDRQRKQVEVHCFTTGAKHAMAIHEGRRPGAPGPPASALKEWCRRVLGDENLAFAVATMVHRWGFSEAHHGGRKNAKFLTRPLEEHASTWQRFFAGDILRGSSPEQAGQRIAAAWQGEAVQIVDEHWRWRGHLSHSIKTKVVA